MRIAYFDCFSGAGGDMIVGSLIDAGADAASLQASLHGMGLEGFKLSISKIKKQGFAATRFEVHLDEQHKHAHRHLKHIREILDRANLPERVHQRSNTIFERLAVAEAKVHNSTIEKVHFHEVGAVDAILDIVGACFAIDMLNVDRVLCSPIPTGSGTVRCEHGLMPIPAPGTAELLKDVPLTACDEPGELTTPTAAAVLTTLAESFGAMPAMSIRSIGYGAGTRDGVTRPNLLRVFIGETTNSSPFDTDQIVVLETNLDDASPQAIAHCMDRLLDAGALDVFTMPIVMKKSRPGTLLTVLCEPTRREEMEAIIFAETPTFGIRRREAARTILRRRFETVQTTLGPIRVKIGESNGGQLTASPEYEDCKTIAAKHNVPLREVIAIAQQALQSR